MSDALATVENDRRMTPAEAGVARQAQQQLAHSAPDARTIALVTLAVLAVFYTLYFAAEFVLPLLFAIVFNLLLAPAKRLLTDRLRLPSMLAALLLIILLFCAIFAVVVALSLPASNWIAKAPQSLAALQERLGFLREPIEFLRKGMDQLERVLQPPTGAQPLVVQQPSGFGGVGLSILLGTRAALGQMFTLAVMLFFLLSTGDSLLRRLVEIMPSFGEKRRVVEIAIEIERTVSGYLFTVTVMNLLVGVANGVSMWLLGIPDPLLWGTLAFLLNYIPILGPLMGMVVFFFVGLFSTPTLWQAILPAAIYLAIHVTEGESITPMLLAKRLTLNPVLVILALFFWDWMWGVAGAFLAVPMLAIAKTIADRVPTLTPVGHVLGGETSSAPPSG